MQFGVFVFRFFRFRRLVYFEQGDRGVVEEVQEEEDDEGRGYGRQVFEVFFFGVDFFFCRGYSRAGLGFR